MHKLAIVFKVRRNDEEGVVGEMHMVSRIVNPGFIKCDDGASIPVPAIKRSEGVDRTAISAKDDNQARPAITLEECLFSAIHLVMFLGLIVVSIVAGLGIIGVWPKWAEQFGPQINIGVLAGRWIISIWTRLAEEFGPQINIAVLVTGCVVTTIVVFIWKGFRNSKCSGTLRIVFVMVLVLLSLFVVGNLESTGKGFVNEIDSAKSLNKEVGDVPGGSIVLLFGFFLWLPMLLGYIAAHVAYYVLLLFGVVGVCIIYLILAKVINLSRRRPTPTSGR
ncbi:MAG: hypothetical protein JXN61_11600 [Sedimentisphaerales bacterium]|nr:hypothetical protein [Sedimentisphaerales bacterium]